MTQTATKRNRYQEQKEARIEWAMDHLSIDTIGDATFATIPSTSGKAKAYTVDIDESGVVPCAVKCDCPANCVECVHYQAVNRFFQRIHSLMHPVVVEVTTPVAEVMADADTAMREREQSELVANDKTYAQAVGYVGDPRTTINAKTGMTDAAWTQYRYYLMGIGAA